ncbi:MAG: MlaE family lipid ABC transporter permease subunit [Gammaproteobacteria bacterium]
MANVEFFTTGPRDDTFTVRLQGDWVFENVETLEQALNEVQPGDLGAVEYSCGGLQNIDIAGAWILFESSKRFEEQGKQVDFVGFRAAHFKFLKQITAINTDGQMGLDAPLEEELHGVTDAIAAVGRHVVDLVEDIGFITHAILDGIRRPSRIALRETIRQLDVTGLKAIPLVALIAFLIGVILAYQSASQLEQFGAQIFVVDFVTDSMLREMGVVLTAIMLAGRSGSAFAAQIGVMKLNEEVNALRVLGLSPNLVLIAPRVVALVIAMPLLTIVANLAGIGGGLVIASATLDISPAQYLNRVSEVADLKTLFMGLAKAPVFAVLIAAVGTLRGMQVSSSSEDLGAKTTLAVVQSIVLIIVVDAIFAFFYSMFDL